MGISDMHDRLRVRGGFITATALLHRDVSALFMEQIMLYRDTRDSILAGLDHDAWRVMPLEARERALQAEMKADCNLHPALYPPSADGSATLGHYKVRWCLRRGADSLTQRSTMCSGVNIILCSWQVAPLLYLAQMTLSC